MGSKLFVGGLSWNTTDASLREAFEAFGDVREARVILDRETGRSRGFGFVTYQRDEDTAGAIRQMNGAMLDGRTIRVNEAEERPRGPG
ncbi:MAG: RNA-binding protein, partial [Myxococcota bacterium]